MTDLTKKLIAGAAIVVLVAACASWLINRGKWQERVDDLEAQVEQTNTALEEYADSIQIWAARRDSLTARDSALTKDSVRIARAAWRVEQDYLETRAELANALAASALDTVPPHVQEVYVRYERALDMADSLTAVCEKGRTNAEDRLGVCEADKAIADSTILVLEELRGRLTSERDSALVLLKPPSLFQFGFDVGVGAACIYDVSNGKFVCGPSAQVTVLKFRLPIL
jgi:hypothetical protein